MQVQCECIVPSLRFTWYNHSIEMFPVVLHKSHGVACVLHVSRTVSYVYRGVACVPWSCINVSHCVIWDLL